MSRLRRALHFVPGANEKLLRKSLRLAADTLILDLEDAVAPEHKEAARETVTRWLREIDFGRQERMVRINPLDTEWGSRDIELTMQARPDAYLVPKVKGAEPSFSRSMTRTAMVSSATKSVVPVTVRKRKPDCSNCAKVTRKLPLRSKSDAKNSSSDSIRTVMASSTRKSAKRFVSLSGAAIVEAVAASVVNVMASNAGRSQRTTTDRVVSAGSGVVA